MVEHKSRGTATSTELRNFVWHCAVAALLSDLPNNPATNAHIRNAIRMATRTAFGKKGVRFASDAARKIKEECGRPWDSCGLIVEHAVPVSEVSKKVLQALSVVGQSLARSDLDQRVSTGNLALIRQHPRVHLIAETVERWTYLAWITPQEHSRLSSMGMQKAMPAEWDGADGFARYHHCNIQCSEI